MRNVALSLVLLIAMVATGAWSQGACGSGECNASNGCTILLCTTLDDPASTLSPAIGPAASQLRTTDYVGGVIGSGLRANAVGEFVAYPQVGAIRNAQGTLDFWYQPFYDQSDPGEYFIFTSAARLRGADGKVRTKPSSLELLKHSSLGNGNALAINYWDGVATETVGGITIPKRWEFWVYPDDYALEAGLWTHFRITWEWASTGVPLRVWQDFVELPVERADGGPAWTGPMGVAPESPLEEVFICGRPAGTGGSLFQYNGACDEVRIFDRPRAFSIVRCGMGFELVVLVPLLARARTRRRR